MNFIRFNSIFVHPVRFLIVAFVCTLLFFSSAFPAAAMESSSSSSSPKDGEVNLNEIQRKTDKTVYDPPMTLEKIQERSEGGINEVQGAADVGKMEGSGDFQQTPGSQQSRSVIDNVKGMVNNLKK